MENLKDQVYYLKREVIERDMQILIYRVELKEIKMTDALLDINLLKDELAELNRQQAKELGE